jgi:hypothetical protein
MNCRQRISNLDASTCICGSALSHFCQAPIRCASHKLAVCTGTDRHRGLFDFGLELAITGKKGAYKLTRQSLLSA